MPSSRVIPGRILSIEPTRWHSIARRRALPATARHIPTFALARLSWATRGTAELADGEEAEVVAQRRASVTTKMISRPPQRAVLQPQQRNDYDEDDSNPGYYRKGGYN